MFPAVFVR